MSDGQPEQAQRLADQLAQEMWRLRHDFDASLLSIDSDIDIALEAPGKPVVLADSADSTGSGAPGDSTAILRRLLERQITCKVLLPIVDQEAVQAAYQAGVAASWNVTSDSLAVWLAGQLSADELILVKSAAIEGSERLPELAARQVINRAFCDYAAHAQFIITIINHP